MCASRADIVPGRKWNFGWCEYREVSRTLLVHEKIVDIEPRPLDVLRCLLEKGTETITKEELLATVWGVIFGAVWRASFRTKWRGAVQI